MQSKQNQVKGIPTPSISGSGQGWSMVMLEKHHQRPELAAAADADTRCVYSLKVQARIFE